MSVYRVGLIGLLFDAILIMRVLDQGGSNI